MKKIVLLSACLLIVLALISCSKANPKESTNESLTKRPFEIVFPEERTKNEKGYSIFSTRGNNKYDFIDHEKYDDLIPELEITVTINGKSYTGSYKNMEYIMTSYSPNINYEDSIGNAFSVDENNNLVSFNLREYDNVSDKTLTEKECISIAEEYVKSFCDLSKYKMEFTYIQGTESYRVVFNKYIKEYCTTEEIVVVVNSYGTIRSYASIMYGKIPDDLPVETIDIDSVKGAIADFIEENYAPIENTRIEYEIDKLYLTVLKDGCLAFIAHMYVDKIAYLANDNYMLVTDNINCVILVD